MHEADEPYAVMDSLYCELLTGQHRRDVDLLPMQTGAPAMGDEDLAVMEGIVEFRQTESGP